MPKFQPKRHNSVSRIKTEFVSSVLRDTGNKIRQGQTKTADEWNLFESGTLRNWLQGHFSVESDEGGGKLYMRYLAYARFLDMADSRRKNRQLKREGYHLYNRQVFGVLYNKTLPALRYGFTEDVKTQIDQALIQAVGSDRNAAALVAKSMRRGY